MKYREMYLVEKCLNHLTNQYIDGRNDGYHSAKQDYCISIINFLNENDKEYVDYGIKYLVENYKDVVEEVLLPILAEYKYSGTNGDLHWDKIPDKAIDNPIYSEENGVDCSQHEDDDEDDEEATQTKHYELDEKNCTPKEKIVLFVMKLLRM